jgi:hypothetical protein
MSDHALPDEDLGSTRALKLVNLTLNEETSHRMSDLKDKTVSALAVRE